MNRIVLIGNGFDMAHGLKTSYADFIDWYWEQRFSKMEKEYNSSSKDNLCTITLDESDAFNLWDSTQSDGRVLGIKFFHLLQDSRQFVNCFKMSTFCQRINNDIKHKGWVDIENDYYECLKEIVLDVDVNDSYKRFSINDLNQQLIYLQCQLLSYIDTLYSENIQINDVIRRHIYAPIQAREIANVDSKVYDDHIESYIQASREKWENLFDKYLLESDCTIDELMNEATILKAYTKEQRIIDVKNDEDLLNYFSRPDQILLLSFNYTPVAELYHIQKDEFSCMYIHGKLSDPSHVIFGYGDDMEKSYKTIRDKNENIFMQNFKSIKYLETDTYRKTLAYLESAPFQVYIMGHSCGNSDRTLLNTIFEHRNCVSIKPFYYKKEDGTDNYLEIIQNISRNFTDMKLMRDRVVNKEYCETLV